MIIFLNLAILFIQYHCDVSIFLISDEEYWNSKLQLFYLSCQDKWEMEQLQLSFTPNLELLQSCLFLLTFVFVSAQGLHLYVHRRYLKSRHYVNITVVFTLFIYSLGVSPEHLVQPRLLSLWVFLQISAVSGSSLSGQ